MPVLSQQAEHRVHSHDATLRVVGDTRRSTSAAAKLQTSSMVDTESTVSRLVARSDVQMHPHHHTALRQPSPSFSDSASTV